MAVPMSAKICHVQCILRGITRSCKRSTASLNYSGSCLSFIGIRTKSQTRPVSKYAILTQKYNEVFASDVTSKCSRCLCSTSASRLCWKCGKSIDITKGQFFCDNEPCGSIQPPTDLDHFKVLGMKKTFDLDTNLLTENYRNLQRLLHPDKFSQKSKEEIAHSELQSSLVNKAYSTLLSPLSRGIYLLEQNGLSLEEGEIQMDPAFLMEIMEINEDLENAESIEIVRKIGSENSVVLNDLLEELSKAFQKEDYNMAKAVLTKLKYYVNIDNKVKEYERMNMG